MTNRSVSCAKRRPALALPFVVMGSVVLLIVAIGALGYGMASANNDPAEAKYMGLRNTTSADTAVVQTQSANNTNGDAQENASSSSTYTSSGFNITTAANQVDAKHEQERQAAIEEQKKKDEEAVARAKKMQEAWNASDALLGLGEVDWSVGETAFIEEWTRRINSYLNGTTLAGYGATFAQAAWDNGVDPRWSPAISNTESGNGSSCFLPHNAWGWGQSSWSSWDDAIKAHVAGLAKGYGYSLTYENAEKYCPPNTEFWFNNTLAQMQKI